jgi:hypothetical protein
MLTRLLTALMVLLMPAAALAQAPKEPAWPNQREGDFIIKNYRFAGKRIPNAKYVIVPASPQTHGHFTHLRAALWKQYLIDFLKELPPQQM